MSCMKIRRILPGTSNVKTNCAIITAAVALATPAIAEQSEEELARQLNNPVASLISVPFQSSFDTRMGPLDQGWKYTLNFQPVIPVSIGRDWNVIIRTIVPYIHQDDVYKGSVPTFEQVL